MSSQSYTITIEAFALSLTPCGFLEYITRIGHGIAARAPELKRSYGIVFRFVVPKGYGGAFGPDVEYLEYEKRQRREVERYPEWESDIYHMPTQYCKFRHMRRAKARLLTVHDVNFMYNKTGLSRWLHKLKIGHRVKKADYLAFITEFAARDTCLHLGYKQPYRVVLNGVTDISDMPKEPVEGIEPGFLFHISSLYMNKRPELLVEMMKYLPDRRLVLAGNLSNAPALPELVAQYPNITLLGHASESQKAWLYANCEAFLFPSVCEGFGLPPLEAMTLGKPVVMSRLTSLPEVGGDAAAYWDDFSPESMAKVVEDTIARFAADPSLSEKAKANVRRFDWDKCVDDYIDYYLSILGIEK